MLAAYFCSIEPHRCSFEHVINVNVDEIEELRCRPLGLCRQLLIDSFNPGLNLQSRQPVLGHSDTGAGGALPLGCSLSARELTSSPGASKGMTAPEHSLVCSDRPPSEDEFRGMLNLTLLVCMSLKSCLIVVGLPVY